MLPIQVALFNAAANFVLICVAGTIGGALACLVLRLHCGVKTLLQDFAIAGGATILLLLLVLVYAYVRSPTNLSAVVWVLAGTTAPVARHALNRRWLSRRREVHSRKSQG